MDIRLLLADFCHHAKFIRNVSDQTLARYNQKVTFFINQNQINTPREISERAVLQFFLEGRIKRGWKTSTYLTYYMTLSVFFQWLAKHNHVEKNFIELCVEKPKLEKSLPKNLRKQDAIKILEVAYHLPYSQQFMRYRNHAVYATFCYTGIRKNELLNLKLADVDLENLSLFIHQGKGNKDRIIPISTTLAQSLRRYLMERKKRKLTSIYFFVSSNRDHRFTDSGLKLTTKAIRDFSKVHFTVHQLRHTFATLMIEGGCDIYSLSRMMGHSDIKTTTIYLSTSAEHLRSQVYKHPLNSRY